MGGDGPDTYSDAHLKFSRLWFDASTVLGTGDRLGARVELDFFGGAQRLFSQFFAKQILDQAGQRLSLLDRVDLRLHDKGFRHGKRKLDLVFFPRPCYHFNHLLKPFYHT